MNWIGLDWIGGTLQQLEGYHICTQLKYRKRFSKVRSFLSVDAALW